MAEQGSGKSAEDGEPSIDEDPLETCRKNLESARKTLQAFDDLDKRWKEVQQKFADTLRISLQSAFGIEAPTSLTFEEQYAVFEGKANIEEVCRRLKDGQYKQIIVMTGAGISVSAGIPDFRSPGTGFYDKLDLTKYDLPSPQSVFELDYFRQNPRPFCAIAKELYPGKYRPTTTHYFIKLLASKGLLLRCYTQNIDGLERAAGIEESYLVEAHGSFTTAKCIDCAKEHNPDKVKSVILADEVPTCEACHSGLVKPSIVFFGEDLPRRFKDLLEPDFAKCDLLIVLGTSLKVQPFNGLIHRVGQTTPRLLINRERVGTFVLSNEGGYRDVAMIKDCDAAVSRICDMCSWTEDLEKLAQQGQSPGDAPPSNKHKTKTTTAATNCIAACTTKPIANKVKEKYSSYKPTSKNKTDHTHKTKRIQNNK